MVTLSVTRSRVTAVLNAAADVLETDGWDPLHRPVMAAIDQASGFVTPGVDQAAEETSLQAWAAVVTHLDVASLLLWEQAPGRTQLQVLAALRGAVKEIAS